MGKQEEAYEKVLSALLGRVLDMLRFAEAKNAALLAFASAWILGVVNLLSSGKPLSQGYLVASQVALPLFITAAVIAIASLLPKLSTSVFTGDRKGRFRNLLFFGDIAELTVHRFQSDVHAAYHPVEGNNPTAKYVSDLEGQIAINSKITRRKHRMFNFGAIAALIAVSAFSIPTLVRILHLMMSP